MTFERTAEQKDIVAASKYFGKLKINAAAGSGKTSTLVMVAQENIVPSLYLAFNKNMAEEAKQRFPSHVEVRTTHSLAYSQTGKMISHKLRRPLGGYKNVCGTGSEIAKHFKMAPFVVTPERSISATAMGYAVKSTLNRFEYSADREIMSKHVSFVEAEKVIKMFEFNKKNYTDRVLKVAKKLWELRIDPGNDILATHDTYLKLFQLTNPDLSCFNIIYLDEAQDSNACVLDIILRQDGKVILVGDTYQSIYGWRGSVNAMEQVNWEERELTKSFRFGQKVADIANKILLDTSGSVFMDIKGFENLDTTISTLNSNEKYTWIFRTNAEMLAAGVDLIVEGKKINIQADISDYISLVESVIALQNENKKGIKHIDVVPFDNWKELGDEVEVTSSVELKRVYKQVVEGKAYRVLNVLKKYTPDKNANITLSTAHKMKGLEADNVVLASDFKGIEYSTEGKFLGFENKQEQNLLYVAATRAKNNLVINHQIEDIINFLESDSVDESLKIDTKSIVRFECLDKNTDLDKMVELKMAEMGFLMDDLDKFVEGSIPTNEDEIDDEFENYDHWTNAMERG